MTFDRCEAAKKVYIAIPTYIGMLAFDTAFSLISAALCLKEAGIQVHMKGIEGNCYIDLTRNELVMEFLASDATDLLFWDADVGCLPDTVMRLCKLTRPVVAAVYPKKTDVEEFPVNLPKGVLTADADGTVEANMIPTGMLRINRRVFTELMPKVKQYTGRYGKKNYAFFETDIREAYYGEDVEFCRIWKELGGKLRILYDETLSHTGPKAWIGNFGNALKAGKF